MMEFKKLCNKGLNFTGHCLRPFSHFKVFIIHYTTLLSPKGKLKRISLLIYYKHCLGYAFSMTTRGNIQNIDAGNNGYLSTRGNIKPGSAVKEVALIANDDGQQW